MVIFTAAERAERVLSGWPMKALAEPKARARVMAENCMVLEVCWKWVEFGL